MEQVDDWLNELGLGRYIEMFSGNDVDLALLPGLTDSDLRELGVASFGHRRKLLRAISELGNAEPISTLPGADETGPDESGPDTPSSAERRQVTVMFCDLVGSTALSVRLDPEDLRDVIRVYQDTCAGAIARFDGYLAKLMGDGVLAYFGYPRAHEDAAERAVRAAQSIARQVRDVHCSDGSALAVRIGIATGLVVIGDIVGHGVAQEREVAGETPNLASRLQNLAGPNGVVIAPATRNLLGSLFELEPMGAHSLAGFSEPVDPWRLIGERTDTDRFAAVRARPRSPLFGRDQELQLLLERWRNAQLGEGQVVLLSGEAGIGKSRITAELRARVADSVHRRVDWQCTPYSSNTALHPAIRAVEHGAGFATADTAATRLEKLSTFVAQFGVDRIALRLLAELLSVPIDDAIAPLNMSPSRQRAETIDLLGDLVAGVPDMPVLFVLEDAHWADRSSLDLLTRIIDAAAGARMMVVVTHRPDFIPPWTGRPHVTALALNRLGREPCGALITAIVALHGLPPATIEQIVQRSDGVPLFVEELTHALVEATAINGEAVPATLQDTLMARLDSLGPAKEIAQFAAVIGREFSRDLLRHLTPVGDAALDEGLTRLAEVGLAYPQRRAASGRYAFKHALVRDAAYESLLLSRRRQLHRVIGEALEQHFPLLAEAEPSLLAYHFSRAGEAARAFASYERAGDQAAKRSAFVEAIAQYRHALEELKHLPKDDSHARRELAVMLKLGPPMLTVEGAASASIYAHSMRVRDLGEAVGDLMAVFRATCGLWFNAYTTGGLAGRFEDTQAFADQLLALAKRTGDQDMLLEALHCRFAIAFTSGDVKAWIAGTDAVLALYRPERHGGISATFIGHDAGVCAHCVRAAALCTAGRVGEARTEIAKSAALAERLKEPISVQQCLWIGATAMQFAGDRATCAVLSDQLGALAREHDFPPASRAAAWRGAWAHAEGPKLPECLATIEAIGEGMAARGYDRWIQAATLAELRAKAGNLEHALAGLDAAIATHADPASVMGGPELHRVRGEILARLGPARRGEAEQSLGNAIAAARRQGATLFELRAATALAGMWIEDGRAANARTLLSEVCGSLHADFDAAALAPARAMLERLAGGC